jgi:hypothetical protein
VFPNELTKSTIYIDLPMQVCFGVPPIVKREYDSRPPDVADKKPSEK